MLFLKAAKLVRLGFCRVAKNKRNMDFKFDLEFAKELDGKDPLQAYRNEFLFPQHKGREVVYLTGNSLGLQPRKSKEALQQELNDTQDENEAFERIYSALHQSRV